MWKKKAIVVVLVVSLAMAWDQYVVPDRQLAAHFVWPGLFVAAALWAFGRVGVSPYLRVPLALAAEPAILLLLLAATLAFVGSPRLFTVEPRFVLIATIIAWNCWRPSRLSIAVLGIHELAFLGHDLYLESPSPYPEIPLIQLWIRIAAALATIRALYCSKDFLDPAKSPLDAGTPR